MTNFRAGGPIAGITLAAPGADVTQELSPPVTMRWPLDLLARAEETAARTGLTRSAVIRLAVLEGLPAVEALGR